MLWLITGGDHRTKIPRLMEVSSGIYAVGLPVLSAKIKWKLLGEKKKVLGSFEREDNLGCRQKKKTMMS